MTAKLKSVAGIIIPDSTIAEQARELLLEHGNEFLYNHSMRVFLFSSLNARRKEIAYDSELLYVSSLFHDLGLTQQYSSADLRFEVDGANAARDFLKGHGLPEKSLQLVWDTIALHTTIGIAEHKEAEVALMYSGVGLDVMGEGYENLSEKHRDEIVGFFPRTDFKKKIIPAFFSGFEHKTETTFGNIKADVCAFMIPNFHRKNFCDCILHSPWSE
ncbi:HD domain-containing protein [Chryseobacterium vrystaatense]|uniref:HD domain-containing protein n=1 Tax=Chryseobacterium vrystaatense TaxID=307480 RepID=A0A1M4WLW7_9FLAO|nr:HD domain-containing protein [Chryseobacterium vrystaatense]KFF27741.1 phosphohydrolase [Chryseobacterium vrystaatense]SHE82043.1 HD domain-containing protein [Chryseobacterium vrystaatense]